MQVHSKIIKMQSRQTTPLWTDSGAIIQQRNQILLDDSRSEHHTACFANSKFWENSVDERATLNHTRIHRCQLTQHTVRIRDDLRRLFLVTKVIAAIDTICMTNSGVEVRMS